MPKGTYCPRAHTAQARVLPRGANCLTTSLVVRPRAVVSCAVRGLRSPGTALSVSCAVSALRRLCGALFVLHPLSTRRRALDHLLPLRRLVGRHEISNEATILKHVRRPHGHHHALAQDALVLRALAHQTVAHD